MRTHRILILSAALGLTLWETPVLGAGFAASLPAACDLRLVVQLTPDVPNPRDPGFLSSLLGNHPSYRLNLRQERDDSLLVLDLTGPAPDDGCQSVVDAMRKDARVIFIRTSEGDL
jgi:hypothetical protein